MTTPTISADITFLTPEEGGRTWGSAPWSPGQYRPHLVVQNPDIRQAAHNGNESTEDYLGVVFTTWPAEHVAGKSLRYTLALLYHPEVDYDSLQKGATFTIREGAKIVGFGTVLSRSEASGPGADQR